MSNRHLEFQQVKQSVGVKRQNQPFLPSQIYSLVFIQVPFHLTIKNFMQQSLCCNSSFWLKFKAVVKLFTVPFCFSDDKPNKSQATLNCLLEHLP